MKESKNTKKATKSAVNIFRSYCIAIERQTTECLEKLPAEELAETLRFFYAGVTKKEGEVYKKSSLNCIREGIARHLKKERNMEDPVFDTANDVFRAQLVELKRQGKGATEHKQPSIGKAIVCSSLEKEKGESVEDTRQLPKSPVSSISLRSPPGSPYFTS